jgi:hypothetical protein
MRSFKSRLYLASLFVLSGCAASGSLFSVADPAPADKGVVYFYRPAALTGGGLNIMMMDNGVQISRIQNGQFIKYYAAPGKHTFRSDTIAIDKAVEFNVEAGKSYFVRTDLRQGMWAGTWHLSRVSPDEALRELKTCCRSGE